MFIADPKIIDLRLKEKNIFRMFYSMNIHQVATPDMSVADARCYIMVIRENGRLNAFIGLYVPDTDQRYYYVHDANPFPDETLYSVEDEANGFAEAMGFLLDEIDVKSMSEDDRNRWLDEQDLFTFKKKSVETAPTPIPAATTAQAEPIQPQPEPPIKAQAIKAEEPVAIIPPVVAKPPTAVAPVQKDTQPPVALQDDTVMQQAVEAGVVKPPKQQRQKKDAQKTAVGVSRDKEALARLFSSF